MRSDNSLARAGLKFKVSSFGPSLYFVFRDSKSTVGDITTRIDDILGCGESDTLLRVRNYLERRFGELAAQEKSFAHVGMGLSRANDFSVLST